MTPISTCRGKSSFSVGMVTGTGQPGGFAGRVSPGTGTGYNFSGPETLGYTAGLRIFNFIMEFKSFQGTNSYSQALFKHLMHSNISISGCISCFEGVEPSRQASAGLIRSIRTTRRPAGWGSGFPGQGPGQLIYTRTRTRDHP
jgi:hypothetical protein